MNKLNDLMNMTEELDRVSGSTFCFPFPLIFVFLFFTGRNIRLM
jgi:hypothetical protein